jgi:hypothetical protein
LLLLGAQRSGTTALGLVLNAAFAETGGVFTVNGKLPYLLHRWCTQADLTGRHLRVDEILHALDRRAMLGRGSTQWRARVEQVLRRAATEVAAGTTRGAGELRRQIVTDTYSGANRWGEKYNEYLLELDQLDRTIPDGQWVLVVRHPAAVAASMLHWRGDRPWRPVDMTAALRKYVAWHEPWLEHAGAERTVVVEYGRICSPGGLRSLSTAMGLDLAPHQQELVERPTDSDVELPTDVERIWRALLERAAP